MTAATTCKEVGVVEDKGRDKDSDRQRAIRLPPLFTQAEIVERPMRRHPGLTRLKAPAIVDAFDGVVPQLAAELARLRKADARAE